MPRTPLRGAVAPSTIALFANAPLLNDSVADDLLVWSRSLISGTPCVPAMRDFFDDEPCVQWVRGLHVAAYWAHVGKFGEAADAILSTQIQASYLDAARYAGTGDKVDAWWWEVSHRCLPYLVELGLIEFQVPFTEAAQVYARDARDGSVEHLLAYGSTLVTKADLIGREAGQPAYYRDQAVTMARNALGLRETHAEAMHDDRPGGLARIPASAPSAADLIETARAPEPVPPGHVIVMPRVGGGSKGAVNKDANAEFKGVLGVPLPLYVFPTDRQALIEEHAEKAPHARRFFEDLVALQDTREHLAIPPVVAIGAPGGGKTTSLDGFFRSLGVRVERYPCDGSSDASAAGTPRRWTSGEVDLPLRAILDCGFANPVCLWDEVNRAGGHRQGSGGTLRDALTSFFEPENARRYRDPYVEAEVDISHVVHACTANGTDGIANQVLDRLRVLSFPLPGPQHMPVLARRMALEIARAQGLPDDHGELDRSDLLALAENWPGGSLRGLRRLVEVAVRVKLVAPYETRQ